MLAGCDSESRKGEAEGCWWGDRPKQGCSTGIQPSQFEERSQTCDAGAMRWPNGRTSFAHLLSDYRACNMCPRNTEELGVASFGPYHSPVWFYCGHISDEEENLTEVK